MSFNYKVYLAYPVEIISKFLVLMLEIVGVAFVWYIASIYSDSIDSTFAELFSYFLVANSIATLSMAQTGNLGRTIRKSTKSGSLNQVIIKPIRIIPYLVAETIGTIAINYTVAICMLILGLVLNPMDNPLVQLPLFILFFIFAICISFAFNIIEGALSFVWAEISGFKNAFRHVFRLFSGTLVPIVFFPDSLQFFVNWLPFAPVVAFPQAALRATDISDLLPYLLNSIVWSVILVTFSLFLWNTLIKKYEGVGA